MNSINKLAVVFAGLILTTATASGQIRTWLFESGNLYTSNQVTKVGIGTANPSQKLHVAQGNAFFDGNVGIGTNPSYPLHLQSSAANIFAASIENQDPTGWGLEVRTLDTSGTRNALEIYTGGISKFLVNTAGNVGIGTTNPQEKLDVVGNIKADTIKLNTGGIAASPAVSWSNDSDTGIGSFLPDTFFISTGGTERLAIDNSGNVGIGTIWPSYPFDVVKNADFIYVAEIKNPSTSGHGLTVRVGSSGTEGALSVLREPGIPLFYVQANGNVGIGTANPAEELDVIGSGRFTDGIKYYGCGSYGVAGLCPVGPFDGPGCDTVPVGSFCEGDGECGTADINNCGSFDWYFKTAE